MAWQRARFDNGTQVDRAEQAALVALLRSRPTSRRPEIVAEVLQAGSALQVWRAHAAPQLLLTGVGEPDPLEAARADLGVWLARGLQMVTLVDDLYPSRLRGVYEAPPVLFLRGALRRDDRAVSVVGSRTPTDRGRDLAAAVATELVRAGVSVVAGLAAGIDTAAHRAALEAGGRTVAVVGTGISRVYPAQNLSLQEEIARTGLVLSQFWPDETGHPSTFPVRNATMSGYGLATVVVEAGETSGARVQARVAVGHGRPVILTAAVVERSRWARDLVGRPGVHVASGVDDVMRLVSAIEHDRRDLAETVRRLAPARGPAAR